MTKVLKRCIYLIFFVVFFVSACYIFKFDYDMYHTQKEAAILNELAVPESAIDSSTPKNEIDVPPNEKEKTPRMQQLETLQKKNADVIACLLYVFSFQR